MGYKLVIKLLLTGYKYYQTVVILSIMVTKQLVNTFWFLTTLKPLVPSPQGPPTSPLWMAGPSRRIQLQTSAGRGSKTALDAGASSFRPWPRGAALPRRQQGACGTMPWLSAMFFFSRYLVFSWNGDTAQITGDCILYWWLYSLSLSTWFALSKLLEARGRDLDRAVDWNDYLMVIDPWALWVLRTSEDVKALRFAWTPV